jgi:hypothetical protein
LSLSRSAEVLRARLRRTALGRCGAAACVPLLALSLQAPDKTVVFGLCEELLEVAVRDLPAEAGAHHDDHSS